MSSPAIPVKTQAARELLAGQRSLLPVPMRMLLINVDGRRSLAELNDIARSLQLDAAALEELQRQGLITGLPETASTRRIDTPVPTPKAASAPAAPPTAMPAQAPSAAPARAPAPASADPNEDLRRLMRAKMFAFDLACRMLAGRDAELRASAREVNSESRFLDWLADASARIEAASDAERAALFRERVAQAAA